MPLTTLSREAYFPNRKARVVINRQVNQRAMRRHRHEFKELVVVLSGEGIHNQNGHRHRIGSGDILFIDEQASHGYEQPRRLNLVNILINREALARMEGDLAGLPGYPALMASSRGSRATPFNWMRLEAGELEQISEWIELMEGEAASGTGAGYIVAEAYLKLILALILRRLEGTAPVAGPRGTFEAVISWLEAHLTAELPVALLASRAGLSERNFYRCFRKRMGTSPARYILRARLQKAATLLKNGPALSCREIAGRCGFKDANYFSTAFRRQHGMSPRNYRIHHHLR